MGCLKRYAEEIPLRVNALDGPTLALTAVFAACLDPRITEIDADFQGRCFEKGAGWNRDAAGLPMVPRVLCYGDIPQWAALLADRKVTFATFRRATPAGNGSKRSSSPPGKPVESEMGQLIVA